MTSVFMGFMGAGMLLALGFSTVSLFLHWKRAEQPPEVTGLHERIANVSNELIDLQDRVGQWMKRDRVRNAREGRQRKSQEVQEADEPISYADKKAELRARAAAARGVTRS